MGLISRVSSRTYRLNMNNTSKLHSLSNAEILAKLCEASCINTINTPEQIPTIKEYLQNQMNIMKRELIKPPLTINITDLRKVNQKIQSVQTMSEQEKAASIQKILKYEVKSKEYRRTSEKIQNKLTRYNYDKNDESKINHLQKIKTEKETELKKLRLSYWDKYSNLPISKG